MPQRAPSLPWFQDHYTFVRQDVFVNRKWYADKRVDQLQVLGEEPLYRWSIIHPTSNMKLFGVEDSAWSHMKSAKEIGKELDLHTMAYVGTETEDRNEIVMQSE